MPNKVVSEADRIKAVERVRAVMTPIFGGTPSYKRKRGIYRALKRGDKSVTVKYEHELMMLQMMDMMASLFYRDMQNMLKPSPFEKAMLEGDGKMSLKWSIDHTVWSADE